MKIFRYILLIAAAMLISGCRGGNGDIDIDNGEQKEQVCISAGTEIPEATRAGNVLYMPNGVRFTAMMLTKAAEGEDYMYDRPFYANMLVDNKGAGNSWYYKSDYSTPTTVDDYNNDDDASAFYWQNRLLHGFIGYIDDYNKALTCAKGGASYSPLALSTWHNEAPATSEGKKDDNVQNILYTMKKDGTLTAWQQYERFDLRTSGKTAMSEQPDPLIAYAEERPTGSSAERNRVYLTFRHQFAQVQVNLKANVESATIEKDQLRGVDLLGVADYANIFPYPEYGYTTAENSENQTVDTIWNIIRQGDDQKLLRTAEADPITLQQLEACPPSGTCHSMFTMAEGTQATGYLKGFEAIAYGNLEYLRIHWEETPEEGKTVHTIDFKIDNQRFRKLESGKRYIFNLELRRGTLAVIKADIIDWIPYETATDGQEYEATGTIVKPSTNN